MTESDRGRGVTYQGKFFPINGHEPESEFSLKWTNDGPGTVHSY